MVLSAGVVQRSELVAELVHRFGTARIRVQGSSMLPALRPGDEVELRSTPFNKINNGDIVAFRQAERLFVHRVIARGPDGVLTQGDALKHADAPVLSSELLGVVVSVLRKGEQIRLQASFASRVTAALFSRSRMCGALFVKFASL